MTVHVVVLTLSRFPLYIDPVFGIRHQRAHSIFNQPEDEEDSAIDGDCLGPVDDPLPDSEQSGQFLSLPSGSLASQQQLQPSSSVTAIEDDTVSRSSTTFATPEGLTPRSSDGEIDQSESSSAVAAATAAGSGGRAKNRGDEEVGGGMATTLGRSHDCMAEWEERTGSDHDTDDLMFLLPKINVRAQPSTEEDTTRNRNERSGKGSPNVQHLKEEAVSTDGSSSSLSCGRELLAPSLLEASDDSSSHFYSESQSTLMGSRERMGLGGSRSSREGSIKLQVNGGGRSNHTDHSATDGAGAEVGTFWNINKPAAASGMGRRNGREGEGEVSALPEATVDPPSYSDSCSVCELYPPPPYTRCPNPSDLSNGGRGDEPFRVDPGLRATSINSSVEYQPVTSSSYLQAVTTEFPHYGSSGGGGGGRYTNCHSSSVVRGRHTSLQAGGPEENYCTGSGLTNGGGGAPASDGGLALGRGVSAEVLHGALSRAQVDPSHPLTGEGRRRKRSTTVVAGRGSEEPILQSPPFLLQGLLEGKGEGKGKKGFWGRRGSKPHPLIGIGYRKDRSMPDVFYSPTRGERQGVAGDAWSQWLLVVRKGISIV